MSSDLFQNYKYIFRLGTFFDQYSFIVLIAMKIIKLICIKIIKPLKIAISYYFSIRWKKEIVSKTKNIDTLSWPWKLKKIRRMNLSYFLLSNYFKLRIRTSFSVIICMCFFFRRIDISSRTYPSPFWYYQRHIDNTSFYL